MNLKSHIVLSVFLVSLCEKIISVISSSYEEEAAEDEVKPQTRSIVNFDMPKELKTKISDALIFYILGLVSTVIVYVTIIWGKIVGVIRKKKRAALDRVSARCSSQRNSNECRRSSRRRATGATNQSDNFYSDGSSNLHRSTNRGSTVDENEARGTRKYTSIDHKVLLASLKKKPAKSILRCSLTNNARGSVNSVVSSVKIGGSVNENVSVLDNASNTNRESNNDIGSMRRSGASIKSVTWNEKTQVRTMYKKKKRSTVEFY